MNDQRKTTYCYLPLPCVQGKGEITALEEAFFAPQLFFFFFFLKKKKASLDLLHYIKKKKKMIPVLRTVIGLPLHLEKEEKEKVKGDG